MVQLATSGSIATNGLGLGGRFNAAKPVLYEVPTYLAGCSIGTLNRKTKRKKAMAKISLSSKEKENIIYLLERQIRMAEKALNTPTMGRNNYDDFKNQINKM